MKSLLGPFERRASRGIHSHSRRKVRGVGVAQTPPCSALGSGRWMHPPPTTAIRIGDSSNTRSFSANASTSDLEDATALPKDGQLQMDFFGEPVTFLGLSKADKTTNAMAATDGFLLATVSKGKSCTGGGGEAGLEATSAHGAALSWSEILRHATVWNHPKNTSKSAPMLAYIAVAPVLAQAGIAYVRHLDTLLAQAKTGAPGLATIQMESLIDCAIAERENPHLNHRERLHLQALYYMRQDEHPTALATLLRLLRTCPGDALALSLAMDLAHTLGDKNAALRAAGSVSSYWNERRGGLVRPAIPGHAMATSLLALGFAVGGRHEEAEQMAARAMNQGRSVCGGLATWAQAHVFDSRGGVAEGISALANFDGIANYEGSGLLFFDCRLSGYGARFCLDREERGRGKSAALRLYAANFDRVLDYSGFARAQPWLTPQHKAPLPWVDRTTTGIASGDVDPSAESIFNRLMGRGSAKEKEKEEDLKYEVVAKENTPPSMKRERWDPSCEDVLTWIPPTPQLLSDATLLLLRFTFNGTISTKNGRWDSIRNSWESMFEIERKHGENYPLKFCPLASVISSLLFPPSETGGNRIGSGRLARGLYEMGELLKLGRNVTEEAKESTAIRELIAEREPSFWLPVKDEQRQQWKEIVGHLASAVDGFDYPEEDSAEKDGLVDTSLLFQSWTFDARPILEHAIVYASCKAGDIESLSLARSICSQGVTLRPNSPEEWWRYSIVLGLLGDEVGSETALEASINFGGGQGARS